MQYLVKEENLLYFEYDGISSRDFKIIITKVNNLSSPEKNIELVEIDGRNGDLLIDKGNYKNFNLEIECAIDGDFENTDITILARQIKTWLQKDSNYKKLVLSSDPNYYYEAVFTNKLDVEEVLSELGLLQLTFSCKPFRKLIASDLITVTTNNTIINNAHYNSLPRLKIFGSGNMSLTINNQNIKLSKVENEIEIDSEQMECYVMQNSLISYQNSKMKGDFPILESGDNKISWIGNITKIEIEPRWVVL